MSKDMILLQTYTYEHSGYTLKLTQHLNINWDHGHYFWATEDKERHIISAGCSVGGVPDRITNKDIKDIFDRWWRDKS